MGDRGSGPNGDSEAHAAPHDTWQEQPLGTEAIDGREHSEEQELSDAMQPAMQIQAPTQQLLQERARTFGSEEEAIAAGLSPHEHVHLYAVEKRRVSAVSCLLCACLLVCFLPL